MKNQFCITEIYFILCVHFGWVKCRAQIPSMGHHSWLYVTSISLSLSTFKIVIFQIFVLYKYTTFKLKCFCFEGFTASVRDHPSTEVRLY